MFWSEGKLYFQNVSFNVLVFQVKKELKEIIQKQKSFVRSRIIPDVTTKHGKLKINRKSELTKIYVDDLASLDSLSVVSGYCMYAQ